MLLTVVADRFFGLAVTRREWIGVGLAAVGLAFLAATISGSGDGPHAGHDGLGIAAYVACAAGAGLLVSAWARGRRHAGVLFGVGAGLMWAASDVAIKGTSAGLSADGAGVVLQPLVAVIVVASLVGLLISAKSLQIGPAVSVIAVTSVAANATTIAAGPIVFGDPIPSNALGAAARLAAFALVIGAAAFTPAPVRAAEIET